MINFCSESVRPKNSLFVWPSRMKYVFRPSSVTVWVGPRFCVSKAWVCRPMMNPIRSFAVALVFFLILHFMWKTTSITTTSFAMLYCKMRVHADS